MRTNFIEVLSNKVEIPIIQRDYAQGRTDSKTSKIRKDFLDVLFELVREKRTEKPDAQIELDFIYGFNEHDKENNTTFVPIDGQQRLTTLWLLYWFVSVKENIPDNDRLYLANFLYETRHSTTEFCKRLIRFKPEFSFDSVKKEIKDQPWYFETWDYDPSIQAMLVALEDIQARYRSLNNASVWDNIGGTACPFYFYKLEMKEVGLTDDLYIKMNSRGKALTEFEYFKAGFSELLKEEKQKERFETSIDGMWIDAVWHIVMESGRVPDDGDIALVVDNSFLNLFNFITSVIAYKKDIKATNGEEYKDTIKSAELLKIIYSDSENQELLFETFDAVANQQKKDPLFWNNTFYFEQTGFDPLKTRLFFLHEHANLLIRCLFHFGEHRGLSFPEQILLHACLTHLNTQSKDFEKRIRTIRNLVVNSENELRGSILGLSYFEAENYIITGDLNVLENFKTDQIEEEKNKESFLKTSSTLISILHQLEDSDILRGSISLLPLDDNFGNRAKKFLEYFDEDELNADFENRCNLLLCFGDYSQDDGSLSNLMSKSDIRGFFTKPGYNKIQFYSKTQTVVLNCLDYFIANPDASLAKKIEATLNDYIANPKDWKYYFIKYRSFREHCSKGYYDWRDDQYCIWKMGKKQFNGYHWDPFLFEATQSVNSNKLTLGNYGNYDKLTCFKNKMKILISSQSNGFLFENGMSTSASNSLLDDLINDGVIGNNGELIVSQNSEGIDLEDRLEKLNGILEDVLN